MIKHVLKSSLCAAIAASTFVASAAQAAPCWGEQQVAAAKIRDLQSRLMVATMRCRAMGIDVLREYNHFVTTNRGTIQQANGVLKAQFNAGYGARGQTEYDRFTTAMANAYGADATNEGVCQQTADRASDAVAANGDRERLLRIAEAMGSAPRLPGGACRATYAGDPR